MSGRERMQYGRGDVETVTQTLELKLIEAVVFGSTPRFCTSPPLGLCAISKRSGGTDISRILCVLCKVRVCLYKSSSPYCAVFTYYDTYCDQNKQSASWWRISLEIQLQTAQIFNVGHWSSQLWQLSFMRINTVEATDVNTNLVLPLLLGYQVCLSYFSVRTWYCAGWN